MVSEKARSGKIPIPHRKFRYHIGFFRYHIGISDTTSVFSDTTSEIPIPHRFFPIPHRYFRCGNGIFPLRAFPIPHRKLFLTVNHKILHQVILIQNIVANKFLIAHEVHNLIAMICHVVVLKIIVARLELFWRIFKENCRNSFLPYLKFQCKTQRNSQSAKKKS